MKAAGRSSPARRFIREVTRGGVLLTTSMAFKAELINLILKLINERKDILASGNGVEDFSRYKYHVGFIAGLAATLELCEEAETTINKRERGA